MLPIQSSTRSIEEKRPIAATRSVFVFFNKCDKLDLAMNSTVHVFRNWLISA